MLDRINLLELIDNELIRSRVPWSVRTPTFYPSEASAVIGDKIIGGCHRAAYYRISGVRPTNPAGAKLAWRGTLGKEVENIVVEQMKLAGKYEARAVKYYDETINLSGELDVVGKEVIDGETIYYSVECCTPNTLLLQSDYRLIEIDQARPSDVITHDGSFQEVKNFQSRIAKNELVYRFRGKFDGLFSETTGEHPVRIASVGVRRPRVNKQNARRQYSVLLTQWKNASDVEVGDFICIPKAKFSYTKEYYNYSEVVKSYKYKEINKRIYTGKKPNLSISIPSKIDITEDFYWLLGLYVAEGSCSLNSVYFSLHEDEVEFFERIQRTVKPFGLKAVSRKLKNSKCQNVSITSRVFRELIKTFCPGNTVARTKCFRYDLINPQYLKSFFEGIYQGNGCLSGMTMEMPKISTAVSHLAYLYFQIAAQLGYHPSLKKFKQDSQFNSEYIYVVQWSINQTKMNNEKLVDGGDFWAYRIRKIDKRFYTGLVYNLEVNKNESYTTGLISVHNCKSIYGSEAIARYITGRRAWRGRPAITPYPKPEYLMQSMLYVWHFRDQLIGCKQLYIARDTGDQREWNIKLRRFEEDGVVKHCAEVDGEPNREYVLEDIRARYLQLRDKIIRREVPDRDFQLRYDEETANRLHDNGDLSDTKYEEWRRGGEIGAFQCSYCHFRSVCYGLETENLVTER